MIVPLMLQSPKKDRRIFAYIGANKRKAFAFGMVLDAKAMCLKAAIYSELPLFLNPIEPNSSKSASADLTIGDSGTAAAMKNKTLIFPKI